ncbi:AMP-binding protein [Streptomyces sp. DSM 44915]|uniref:AMP-binding protein n=1 Tax=Streptomyces chisholmiae TaxID=3075540 RepID=A0ABU2JUA3_9ACTN|nr:AMP-binding protein [Streptomyces sp. DSM 44915]MDT0268535.1 AMP-binding protein [Streptomyces sp. DSM 44915]
MSPNHPPAPPVDVSAPADLPFPQPPANAIELAAHYRAAGHWRGEPLGRLLREAAVAHPDRVALVDGERRWSYARLDGRVDRMAAGLAALGVTAGDRVVVQLPNVAAFFEVLFALFRLGALPVLAQPEHRDTEVRFLCAGTEARVLVVPDLLAGYDHRALASRLRPELPSLRAVLVAGEPGPHTALETVPRDPVRAAPEPDPAGPALLRLAGPTGGLPQLVAPGHDALGYTLRAAARVAGVTEDTVQLCALPLARTLALGAPGALGTLAAGGRVVLSPSPAPDVAFPLIAAERVTHTALVPPLALGWIDAAAHSAHDLSSLTLLQVGGAPLDERAARRVRPALGCALQQVFCTAEGLVTATRLDDPVSTVVGTCGRPLSPADELRVVDETGTEVPPGTPGRLLARGPGTVPGYWRAPEQDRFTFTEDGFHRTGELVRIAEGGELTMVGRTGRQINRGGQRVAAEEVENHLLAHPAVREARVFGLPDGRLGERVGAHLIARAGAEPPSARAVAAFLRERGLAGFKLPDLVEFVAALPRAAAG